MITSKQRAFLLSLANTLSPVVMVGKLGLTEQVEKALTTEFSHRELLKLKFQDFKDKKDDISRELAEKTGSELVRIVGNIAIFYKRAEDPKKRAITLPST